MISVKETTLIKAEKTAIHCMIMTSGLLELYTKSKRWWRAGWNSQSPGQSRNRSLPRGEGSKKQFLQWSAHFLVMHNRSVMNRQLCGSMLLCWEVVPCQGNNALCKEGCGRLTKTVSVGLLRCGMVRWRFRSVSSNINGYYCLKEEWGMVRPLYFKEFIIQCPF